MRLSDSKLDEKRAKDGDWVEHLPGFGDFAVKTKSVTRGAALAFQRALVTQTLGRKARALTATPSEVLDYANARTLSEKCVIDWRNLEAQVNAAGDVALDDPHAEEKPVAFSKAALEAILLEPAPDGRIATEATDASPAMSFQSPCGRRARYATRDFLLALLTAAARVDEAPVTDDATDETDAVTEKN